MPGGTFEDDEFFVFWSFFNELIHLRAIYSKRFFDKDVFAGAHRGDSRIEMHKGRCGDNNGVDIVVPQDVAIIRRAVGDIIFFLFFGEDLFIDICEPEDVCPVRVKGSVEVEAGNHTCADYTDIWFAFHFAFLMAMKR